MLVMDPLKSTATALPEAASPAMELVCPAGSLPALKAAVDHGANCVYLGLRDATNARNFAGLNFDEAAIAQGMKTMRVVALEKAREGLTTLEQVLVTTASH